MKKRKIRHKFKQLTPLEAAHEIALGLYKANIIDAKAMREFDLLCIPKIREFTAIEIKKLRLREKLSQPIFAKCLNTSPSTVKQWEQGEKHPRGTSLKLLNLVYTKGISVLLNPSA